jgi:hypothetical protein
MNVRLNKDFQIQLDAFMGNVAHAAGAKRVVKRLLKVIYEYDPANVQDIGDAWEDGQIIMVDDPANVCEHDVRRVSCEDCKKAKEAARRAATQDSPLPAGEEVAL